MSELEKALALAMVIQGDRTLKEICDIFGVYDYEIRRIAKGNEQSRYAIGYRDGLRFALEAMSDDGK